MTPKEIIPSRYLPKKLDDGLADVSFKQNGRELADTQAKDGTHQATSPIKVTVPPKANDNSKDKKRYYSF